MRKNIIYFSFFDPKNYNAHSIDIDPGLISQTKSILYIFAKFKTRLCHVKFPTFNYNPLCNPLDTT